MLDVTEKASVNAFTLLLYIQGSTEKQAQCNLCHLEF